jgi:hypothetical protein
MKKWIAYILVFTMMLSMTGCGCKHYSADLTLTDIDTATLSAKWSVTCVDCGKELEKREAATGVAPKNSTIQLSAAEWQACLDTNRQQLGASQTLYPYPAESADNALIHSMVSMSQMFSVFSYRDKDGNVITTDQQDERNVVHNIYIEAQFTNDNVKEFFMLLMLTMINNNSALTFEEANTLCSQIMGGSPVTDNGYIYAMEIISPEDHKVGVSITAE